MEKQVSRDATENKVYISCIFTFRSRFSHYAQKTLIFDALLRAKKLQICCIITRKSRFYHDATENKEYIWCIITFRSRFSHDAPKLLYLMHYYVIKQIFSRRAKKCKFVALWRGKVGFPMTRKNSYIWCIYTWKAGFLMTWPKTKCTFDTFRSMFSHNATKTLIFDTFLRGKAGFLMTRQKTVSGRAGFPMTCEKLLYLMH